MRRSKRTKKGNVKAEVRKRNAVLSKGRFPIFDRKSAASAIKLRGHSKSKTERRKVLKAASKYQPKLAREAIERDKKKNLI